MNLRGNLFPHSGKRISSTAQIPLGPLHNTLVSHSEQHIWHWAQCVAMPWMGEPPTRRNKKRKKSGKIRENVGKWRKIRTCSYHAAFAKLRLLKVWLRPSSSDCKFRSFISGVATGLPGGDSSTRRAEMRKKMRKVWGKIRKNWSKFEENMRKVELLLTRDCEAGYGPVLHHLLQRQQDELKLR